MKLRAPWAYDYAAASEEAALFCEDPSRTIQSQREEADINVLVRRFGLTGAIPASVNLPSFQDYDAIFDFQSAMNAVRRAEDSFLELPANVRSRFDNSPQLFLEFCSDPSNLPALRELGLAKAAPAADSASNPGAPSGGAA